MRSKDSRNYLIGKMSEEVLYNVLIDMLGMKDLIEVEEKYSYEPRHLKKFIFLKKEEHFLGEINMTLSYLARIFDHYYYNHSEEELQLIRQFINASLCQLNNSTSTEGCFLDNDLLTDDRVGVIEMFPTDYTLGVYLPVAVMLLSPVFFILKSKITVLYKAKIQ